MSTHDESHERSLEQLMESGSDRRVQFAGSSLAGCPTCAQIFEETLAIEHTMVRARERERSAAAEMRRAAARESEGEAEAFLREHVRASSRHGLHPRWWLLAGGLIAAGLLLWFQLFARESDPLEGLTNEWMGAEISLVHPVGTVDAYAPFQWQAELPGGGWFQVRVFEETQELAGTPLAESGRLRESIWRPDPETLDGWPDRIVWTLEVYTGANASDRETPIVQRAQRRR